ncbi:MAG TPA: nuclear transport factor 2 family protein [Steroidobacteraceae bacterium]|nr:nuclear transport factor 2 family protein [Steroidobacteraceae bacterium]
MKIAVMLVTGLLWMSASLVLAEEPSSSSAARPAATPTLSPRAMVQAYVAAWNRHDPNALDDLLRADSVHEDIPAGFHGLGPAQIKAFAAEVFKAQPDLRWKLTRIVESGSTVAAEWTWTATYTGDGPSGPVKGQKISARGASFAVIKDGHISRFSDYYDFSSAFAPPPGSATR